jgi:hypothetical protein
MEPVMLLLFALAALQEPPNPMDLPLREQVMCWGVASATKQLINPSAPAAELARRFGEADELERAAREGAGYSIRHASLGEEELRAIFADAEREIGALTEPQLVAIYDRCRSRFWQTD